MSKEPRLDDLLAPLRDAPAELEDRFPEIDRDRVFARMSAVVANASFERARRKRIFMTLAIAAALALALGAAGLRRATSVPTAWSFDVTAVTGEVAVKGPASRGIAQGQSARLTTESNIETAPGSEAHVRAASGVELEVFEGTRLALADLEPRSNALRLELGAVRCRVPRLAPGQTFSVVTPDARVVVHGTVFSVEVRSEAATTTTSVRVYEGEVVVYHASGDVTLRASQAWTSRTVPDPLVVAAPSNPRAVDETTVKEHAAPRAAVRRRTEPPTTAPGTLDEETRLLRSGLMAERSDDLNGAAAAFELLLSRYPQSPLLPDARESLTRVRMRQGKRPP